MKKDKISKINVIMLTVLVAIQPILELTWFHDGTIGEVFGFTIPTIIRFGMTGIIFFSTLVLVEKNKKNLMFIIYLLCVSVFAVVHHITCIDFNSYVPGDFGYNFLSEMLYLGRMILPVLIIYIVINSKINRKWFSEIVVGISAGSSLFIIVTNITKTALGSYSNKPILGNIFDWFLNQGKYAFSDLSSKGFFYWSIYSTVLVLILPYLLYLFIDTSKKRYLLIAILQGIALYMVGTKATTFSVVLIFGIMYVVYIVCSFFKKDYTVQKVQLLGLLFSLILMILIFPYTPAVARENFDKQYQAEKEEEFNPGEQEKITNFEMYLEQNYASVGVEEEFILNSYNYKYDIAFWENLLGELGPAQRMQNRIIEQRMLERVKAINDDKMDDFFGLGYSRTSNIYNLERDFLYQYYSIGIVGVILFLGPYVGILIVAIGFMLIKFKDKATVLNCSLVLGIGLSLFLAYYSGNVLENLGITIMLAVVCGYLITNITQKNEKKS